MASFTATQGRYLSFIQAYTELHGIAPAESEIAAALCVSAPSVNQMVRMLERKGLLARQPGTARSLHVLVPETEIPSWRDERSGARAAGRPAGVPRFARLAAAAASPPVNLYVLKVFLASGPLPPKFAAKEISRVIEIRGDQTLDELHDAIFKAYERWDQHFYEFQFGRRPFDPDGPNYSVPEPGERGAKGRDARQVTLDEAVGRRDTDFGYWFDFGDDWYHEIQVVRIEKAIPTVSYPRVGRRVGKSPPQYFDNDDDVHVKRSSKVRRPARAKRR